jgi:hypothetical protein
MGSVADRLHDRTERDRAAIVFRGMRGIQDREIGWLGGRGVSPESAGAAQTSDGDDSLHVFPGSGNIVVHSV